MKRYVIVERQDYASKKIAEEIRNRLEGYLEYDSENPEIVITVGGDGTVLYAVHEYMDSINQVSFIGYHTGTLGFLTDYDKEELDDLIQGLIKGEYEYYQRSLIEFKTGGKKYLTLNEVRFESPEKSMILEVFINNEYLETFRGNGLCVSTASGSTAYNKTLGGAVVLSGKGIMQMSEIQGISNNAYRSLGSPVILDDTHHIHLHSKTEMSPIIGYDHLVLRSNGINDIDICMAKDKATFIRIKHVSLIDRLRRAFI